MKSYHPDKFEEAKTKGFSGIEEKNILTFKAHVSLILEQDLEIPKTIGVIYTMKPLIQ